MIYWIDQIENCRIGISARPQGFKQLANEIAEFHLQNINLIISLLEYHEIDQFGLFEEEQYCKKYNIKFESLPIQDNLIPGFQRFADKIDSVFLELMGIENLVVHCNHGLGRSGLLVVGLLLKSGLKLDGALKIIELNRGFKCPTSISQMKFIRAYDFFLNGQLSGRFTKLN
jgi:protein-tyrosine phosphatase